MNRLSPNFTVEEFACKCGKCNYTTPSLALVAALEELREALGNKPLRINSGLRCPAHNKAVEGSPTSQHVKGTAADVRPPKGMTSEQLAKTAENIKAFQEGGIGIYPTFVHLDVRGYKARWRDE